MTTLREKMRARGELLLAHAPILTLGCTLISTLSLMTLATATVLSTVSPTRQTEKSTLAENISGVSESLEVKVGELNLKVTGRSTTEVLTILKKTLNDSDLILLNEEFYPYTRQRGS